MKHIKKGKMYISIAIQAEDAAAHSRRQHLLELGKAETVEEAELMTQAIRPETNIKPHLKPH